MNGQQTSDDSNGGDNIRRILLADGRELAYAEYGDAQGRPVFFFHGLPSSRLMHPDAEVCRSLGIRLVTVDRPGFGRSDPKPGRSLLDWADDVQALADQLGVDQFAVVGPSGGGPFVAACAYRLPTRIKRAAIVGGAGPIDKPGALKGAAFDRRVGYWLARRSPMLLRVVLLWRGNPNRDAEKFFASYTRHNPSSDQVLLGNPEIKAMFLATYREATRQGLDALAHELELIAKPWGFSLQEILVPTTIWHGTADNSTPICMAQTLARTIPSATLRLLRNEGHLIFLSHWQAIAENLIA
jgi:pimeloyl-ACP methyl ester carboxylesterase